MVALPALLNTSLLALLAAGVPLRMIFTATMLVVSDSERVIKEPAVQDISDASSIHALAFSSKGHLLLHESDGPFEFDTWEQVHDQALSVCRGAKRRTSGSERDTVMDDGAALGHDDRSLESFVRETVADRIWHEYAWKMDQA